MNVTDVHISRGDARKLLSSLSGDVALLYLYIQCGNDPETAAQAIRLTDVRFNCAAATLRQLGLWPEPQQLQVLPGQRPSYTESDVLDALDSDHSFRLLYGEVQRVLGRNLNTEELKILLGFIRYLGLSPDVISVLVCYCKDRARQRGRLRTPSLRAIEKEAYAWAEQNINTMEEAAAFIQAQNARESRLNKLQQLLQIRGRNLTAAEERYAQKWLDMDFDDEALTLAYERTCLNTGGLKWPYMNGILTRWHEAGLHTGAQVRNGDRKPDVRNPQAPRQLDAEEQAAIARMLREG